MIWQLLNPLLSLKRFHLFASRLQPWLRGLTVLLLLSGLVLGLFFAPQDYQQGDAFRVIYIHVPAAFLSLFVYTVMAASSVMFLIWRLKVADIVATASAGIGAGFTLLALVTGAIWGKPMWGTWWIWDARLTSELILFFIYMGVISLRQALPQHINQTAVAIVILLGFIDIPLIHYSVNWWNTLHQGPSLSQFQAPHIAAPMLLPLLLMIAGFMSYYFSYLLARARYEILGRERQTDWVKAYWQGGKTGA